jgi:polyhydroxyalkanoate synthesis regulator phasin
VSFACPVTDSVEATPSNDHSRPGTYDGGYGVPEEPQAVANRQVEESGDDDVVPANAKPLKVNCPKLLIAGATDLLLELPPLNRHETATVQYRFALSTLGLLTSTVLPSFGRKWETATDPIEPASYYMRDAGPDTFVIRITNLTQLSAYNVRVVVANALGTTEGLESGEICTTDHVQDAVRQRSRQEGELTARRSMLPLMEALRSQVAATEADAASVRRELEETRSMLSNSTLDNRVLTSEVNSLKRQIEKLECVVFVRFSGSTPACCDSDVWDLCVVACLTERI